jgi:hypothetical protein
MRDIPRFYIFTAASTDSRLTPTTLAISLDLRKVCGQSSKLGSLKIRSGTRKVEVMFGYLLIKVY